MLLFALVLQNISVDYLIQEFTISILHSGVIEKIIFGQWLWKPEFRPRYLFLTGNAVGKIVIIILQILLETADQKNRGQMSALLMFCLNLKYVNGLQGSNFISAMWASLCSLAKIIWAPSLICLFVCFFLIYYAAIWSHKKVTKTYENF